MLLNVFIDEAGTHADSPFMTLGGYAGTLGQWAEFNRRWKKLLKRWGLTTFHTKDFLNRADGYKWPYEQQVRFVYEIIELAEKTTLFGFSIRLDKSEYEQIYRAEPLPKVQLDTRYGLCFRAAVSLILPFLKQALKREDFQIDFILEAGDKSAGAGDVKRIFDQIKKANISDVSPHLNTLQFARKTDFPALQLADGLASNSYQIEPEAANEPAAVSDSPFLEFEDEVSLKEACKIAKVRAPIFRCYWLPGKLEEARKSMIEHTEFKKRYWLNNREAPSGEPQKGG